MKYIQPCNLEAALPCAAETASADCQHPLVVRDIEFVGQMQNAGFTSSQWLVRRNGCYIQMSELLYRVAEQANGKQTLGEIARAVTQATDWIVDADDVAQLIETGLMPLGLIASSDVATIDNISSKTSQSPLNLNMRMKTIGPRVIRPIARVLQVLHQPFIVLTLLMAAFAAHWWLYAPHGLMAGLEDAMATPGGLLFIVALTLLAGCFHEFGHASALQYGGGQASSMGIGLYLVYPVFYTDVTDGYRLSRGARIRTDLGGIYFHLIFASALILAAHIFHRELLLLAVLLIDLDIIRQFIPFVKLDGYWMIADLTGIPDMFSQMSPFLRSVSHTRSGDAPNSAELKRWVKIVLAVYILLTIPVLAYLFILLVSTLPTILMTAVDAFYMQSKMIVAAWRQGAFPTVVLILVTAFFIVVSVIGSFYTVYAFGRYPSIRLWKWSKPVMVRQIGLIAAAAAILTLAAFSWMPQFRTAWESSHAGQASKADKLIAEARQATAQASTLRADVEGSLGDAGFTGILTLKRPNLARLEIKSSGGLGDFLIVSDGKKLYTYFPHDNRYIATIPGPKGENIDGVVLDQMQQFFQPESIGDARSQSYAPQVNIEIVKGKEYEVVAQGSSRPPRRIFRYYISPQDRLVHRVVTIGDAPKRGKRAPVQWAQLNNVRLNAPVDDSVFHWTLPSGASPSQLPNDLVPLGKLLGGS